MIIEAIILGIIIGLIRGGTFSRLGYINFRGSVFFLISLICYLMIVVMHIGNFEYNTNYYSIILLITYIFILIGLLVNIKMKHIIIIVIGCIMNLIVFITNNLSFPINSEKVNLLFKSEYHQLLINNNIRFYIPVEGSKLKYLANIIAINRPYLSPLILSVGDLIIALGIIILIQSTMTDKYIKSKTRLQFDKKLFK